MADIPVNPAAPSANPNYDALVKYLYGDNGQGGILTQQEPANIWEAIKGKDPAAMQGLMMAGLTLMQNPQPGQNFASQLAHALATGIGTFGKAKADASDGAMKKARFALDMQKDLHSLRNNENDGAVTEKDIWKSANDAATQIYLQTAGEEGAPSFEDLLTQQVITQRAVHNLPSDPKQIRKLIEQKRKEYLALYPQAGADTNVATTTGTPAKTGKPNKESGTPKKAAPVDNQKVWESELAKLRGELEQLNLKGKEVFGGAVKRKSLEKRIATLEQKLKTTNTPYVFGANISK